MKFRKLGNTGLDVSVLSFGASSLGSVFRQTDDSESIRTVHTAIETGINYIDVSPYYGLTKAESVLGKAIQQLPRDKFLLSSKAGRYGESTFDFTAKRILSSVEESLDRLHTDYLDILFLHDIEFVPADIILEEAVPAMQKLKEQGKIRFSGISGLPLQLFETLLPQIDVDAILSYCHYSLNDTSLLKVLPLLQERGVGLVNASPLAMGLLSTRETADWHPASSELKKICRQAAEFCASEGADIAKLAVQYSTDNEQIPTTLVSTASPGNILKNAGWTDEPIDRELLMKVQEILMPIHNESWVSGRPEYNERLAQREGSDIA
ncbi:aldo/keto reductase [Paenibacillus sp. HN-1]|uniref:aldo/keto reductase n=1 Tax=Paenibacillus TaxID=44249 RepID=UPI001CAA151A|nr:MULTISPECIES: aldo/keto reductase [Paenibacillus]MBY9078333.1 aldo/keto reductase [Paenibacillus sp. CGMCC 1.18879]MBY9086011.1 aldo/keto reductase [Paenibacillus sinensis]